jgi:predicted outer membrane repeat protein
VVNALFARNSARTHGSALYLGSTGLVQILHATLASPTLSSGAAIYVYTGTVGITNTIVASYTTGIQQMGGAVYEDYNLFFLPDALDKASAVGGAHDVAGDPLFVNPAGDNYHLAAGSPAIDTGANVGVATDLDGVTRPQGNGYDIGAYEYRRFTVYLPIVIR